MSLLLLLLFLLLGLWLWLCLFLNKFTLVSYRIELNTLHAKICMCVRSSIHPYTICMARLRYKPFNLDILQNEFTYKKTKDRTEIKHIFIELFKIVCLCVLNKLDKWLQNIYIKYANVISNSMCICVCVSVWL